jgi:hypothetical protein
VVKALISGLLGKKDAPSQAQPAGNDPPDELPPLAEDVVASATVGTSVQQTVQATSQGQQTIEPPAQLPDLDFQKKADSFDVSGGLADAQAPHSDLPEAIQKAKMAKMKEPEDAQTAPSSSTSFSSAMSQASKVPSSSIGKHETGFFASVMEQLRKEDTFKEKLLEGDLYLRMNNYWELKKHEIKSGSTLSSREQLEKDLLKAVEDLKMLEAKWQIQKMALEEDLKYLEQREREIQFKAKELQQLSNELLLFKNVKPAEYFRLQNGVVLKNLHDLIDNLEVMDDSTFHHHVKDHKNDFSEWIVKVYTDHKLAEKVGGAKSRAEMIEVLQTTPVAAEHNKKLRKGLLPTHYFYLQNGVVLRSLRELSDALKEMDDELFDKHVTHDRNDFAEWVKHVFTHEDLAASLAKCHARKDMIKALDVYI